MSEDWTPTQERAGDSVVLGDRLCVACAYNLRGQPVYRESEYGLYLVRCPECGTPAAIQEYPMLGRWPGRLRVLALVGYIVLLMMMFGFSSLMIAGMGAALTNGPAEEYTSQITHEWVEYEYIQHTAGNDILTPLGLGQAQRSADGRLANAYWVGVGKSWWRQTRESLPFTRFRHRLSMVLGVRWNLFVVTAVLFFGIGALWPVVMISAPRRWIVALIPLPVVFVYLINEAFGNTTPGFMMWDYAITLANHDLFLPGFLVTSVMWFFFGLLGVVFGRPLARLFVRVMVPPTLRGGLAELWFTDGKPLPTGTRMSHRLYPEINHPQPGYARETDQ